MAKLLKLRRGTTTQHASFTGAEGEVTIDTTKDTAVVHDGAQAGGRPLAREEMSNVSSASIAGRLGTDSIATTKIAGGALPTDVTVASANIVDGSIVNADIAANAAIAGTKLENSGVSAGSYGSSSAIPIVTVDAQGLVTAASTTAIDSTTIANGTSSVSVANGADITINRSGTNRVRVNNGGLQVLAGNFTNAGNSYVLGGNVYVQATTPIVHLQDTNDNPDYEVKNQGGNFIVRDATNGADRLHINTSGTATIAGNLDVGAGVDVTGNITATGTVDGRDVAQDGGKLDELYGGSNQLKETVHLRDGVTATTQAQSNNSIAVSTTAYVRTAISEAQAFPSGTKMLFQQTAAPTGWTKVTSGVDNKALRVVSGSVSSGGSNAFSNTFASRGITANAANTTAAGNVSVANTTQTGNVSVANTTQTGNVSVSIANANTGGTVNSHTLTVAEMPSHNHSVNPSSGAWANYQGTGSIARSNTHWSNSLGVTLGNTGGGGGHSHGFTGGSHGHNANASFSGSAHNHNASFSGDAHNHNASFTGSAHNHSISVTNLDLAVQYLDVIIASKD